MLEAETSEVVQSVVVDLVLVEFYGALVVQLVAQVQAVAADVPVEVVEGIEDVHSHSAKPAAKQLA